MYESDARDPNGTSALRLDRLDALDARFVQCSIAPSCSQSFEAAVECSRCSHVPSKVDSFARNNLIRRTISRPIQQFFDRQ